MTLTLRLLRKSRKMVVNELLVRWVYNEFVERPVEERIQSFPTKKRSMGSFMA